MKYLRFHNYNLTALTIAFLLLSFLAKSQPFEQSRISIVNLFMKSLLAKDLNAQYIAANYTDYKYGQNSRQDTIFTNLLRAVKKQNPVDTTINQLKVLAYTNLKGYTNIRSFKPNDSNNIYVVLIDDKISIYIQFADQKIHSFFALGKGNKENSYFVVP